jgi:hypothetical protein
VFWIALAAGGAALVVILAIRDLELKQGRPGMVANQAQGESANVG